MRSGSNARPSDRNWVGLEIGADGRFLRTHAEPRPGDRFDELTVLGMEKVRRPGKGDAVSMVRVQCSCGAEPHLVYETNLRRGKSTRCNSCAKKKSGHWWKRYYAYADICPDEEHRRRLLNRVSSCIGRCHNKNLKTYANYGGRGIHVHEAWRKDRRAFLQYLLTLEGWDRPDLELDRIDVDKGYEPGNLRFITKAENAKNKRSVQAVQRRITELEARVRHLEQRAAESLHDLFG